MESPLQLIAELETLDITDEEIEQLIQHDYDDDGKIIPVSEEPLNHFKNRSTFEIQEKTSIEFKTIFGEIKHYRVKIRENKMHDDILQTLKKIIQPDKTYGIYLRQKEIEKPLLAVAKENFNNSAMYKNFKRYRNRISRTNSPRIP